LEPYRPSAAPPSRPSRSSRPTGPPSAAAWSTSAASSRPARTLLELALGFVTSHRAVTSAIIGPGTREQPGTLLAAQDVVLGAATLDRIDHPSLTDAALRRR